MRVIPILVVCVLTWLTSASPLPSHDIPFTKLLYPTRNRNIDRYDPGHLKPSHTQRVLVAELSQGTLAMTTTYQMRYPAVVLEDSALITHYECGGRYPRIKMSFANEAAFYIARAWPEKDLVLVTSDPYCNPHDERGVYRTDSTVMDLDTLTMVVSARRTSWEAVTETTTIDVLGAMAHDSEPPTAMVVQGKRGIESRQLEEALPV